MVGIIAGRNPVIEALKSGRGIDKIWLARNMPSYGIIADIVKLAQTRGITVEYAERQALDRVSSTDAHQGVIAYAVTREYVSLDDLLAIPKEKNEPPFYVVLDGIEDPHNLGAILRTAEASGVHGAIIRSRRAVGLTPAVIKASAGAVEYVPVAKVTNISQTIETLKKNDIWVVGIDVTGQLDYTRVDFRLATAIVIGGEGQGLSALVRKRCDSLASIPMKGKIASLNASVAAAVVMYEALRQRSYQ
ncbi:MAG: putative TrmH family tRNA/rRNA methyltransferase [Dehalococcoidales bacterium]|nr:putative TrmH family tRNA/rRNA methyltransferase [Dehalococcoidales bacterium]